MLIANRTLQNFRFTASPLRTIGGVLLVGLLSHCTSSIPNSEVVVSVKDQKLGIYGNDGKLAERYAISTSKFGIGDQQGSYRTPLGQHEVIAKIGHGLPSGAVLKCRHWNGEVLKPNAPGRDPIVSRILWLRGMERSNKNAFNRFIYIHGTTEESRLGTPASYGCVRMGMKDVVDLFNNVNVGDTVVITKEGLPRGIADKPAQKTPDDSNESLKHAPTAPSTQPKAVARLVSAEGKKKLAPKSEAPPKFKVASQTPSKSKART